MDKLIDTIIDERSKIGDFDTVLKALWIEASDMNELDSVDALCKIIQATC